MGGGTDAVYRRVAMRAASRKSTDPLARFVMTGVKLRLNYLVAPILVHE